LSEATPPAPLITTSRLITGFPGGHSEWEPPDSIPNSVVKTLCADDSVGFPHVKVGHCQVLIRSPRCLMVPGAFLLARWTASTEKEELTPLLLSVWTTSAFDPKPMSEAQLGQSLLSNTSARGALTKLSRLVGLSETDRSFPVDGRLGRNVERRSCIAAPGAILDRGLDRPLRFGFRCRCFDVDAQTNGAVWGQGVSPL
jgi:hypothetical protein